MGVIPTPTSSPFQVPSFKGVLFYFILFILFIYLFLIFFNFFFFSAALGLLKGRHRFPPAFSQVPKVSMLFFYALET